MSHKGNTRNIRRTDSRTMSDRLATIGMSTWRSAGRSLQLVRQLVQLGPAGHEAGQLLAVDLALGERPQAPAPVEQQEPVPDGERVVRVVGDQDDAHPAVARLRDVAQHDAG